MEFRVRLVVFGAFLALLVGLAVTRAQVQIEPRMIVPSRPPSPMVIAGPDVGFRVTGLKGETPVGQLVVRNKNGEWKVVEFSASSLPLAK